MNLEKPRDLSSTISKTPIEDHAQHVLSVLVCSDDYSKISAAGWFSKPLKLISFSFWRVIQSKTKAAAESRSDEGLCSDLQTAPSQYVLTEVSL